MYQDSKSSDSRLCSTCIIPLFRLLTRMARQTGALCRIAVATVVAGLQPSGDPHLAGAGSTGHEEVA